MLKTPLIGVNNRDLTQFTTDIETTIKLMPHLPPEKILVTESGITDTTIVLKMSAAGVGVYLVGGALMGSVEPGAALAALFSNALV